MIQLNGIMIYCDTLRLYHDTLLFFSIQSIYMYLFSEIRNKLLILYVNNWNIMPHKCFNNYIY